MSAVIVWGAAEGGRRQHAYDTLPDEPWWPNHRPKSVCNNARSPEMAISPAAGLPRCRRCEVLAAKQIEGGRAREIPEPVLDPDCRDGKCDSCVGGPCECSHHQTADHAGGAS